jgi:hypothetical protein
MMATVKSLRKYRKQRALELLPVHLYRYMDENILVSSWYSEEDWFELMKVAATMIHENMPSLEEDVWVFMGQMSAQHDLSTIYARLIKPGDPEGTLRNGGKLWNVYHDTGSLLVATPTRGHVRVELVGYELSPSKELCRLNYGWATTFLKMGGATEIKALETQCRTRGGESCVWEADWK